MFQLLIGRRLLYLIEPIAKIDAQVILLVWVWHDVNATSTGNGGDNPKGPLFKACQNHSFDALESENFLQCLSISVAVSKSLPVNKTLRIADVFRCHIYER